MLKLKDQLQQCVARASAVISSNVHAGLEMLKLRYCTTVLVVNELSTMLVIIGTMTGKQSLRTWVINFSCEPGALLKKKP